MRRTAPKLAPMPMANGNDTPLWEPRAPSSMYSTSRTAMGIWLLPESRRHLTAKQVAESFYIAAVGQISVVFTVAAIITVVEVVVVAIVAATVPGVKPRAKVAALAGDGRVGPSAPPAAAVRNADRAALEGAGGGGADGGMHLEDGVVVGGGGGFGGAAAQHRGGLGRVQLRVALAVRAGFDRERRRQARLSFGHAPLQQPLPALQRSRVCGGGRRCHELVDRRRRELLPT